MAPAAATADGLATSTTSQPLEWPELRWTTEDAVQRRTRGMPRPIHAMISRWISLFPPPKVKITALR
ncbi:hypothetical protein SLAV_32775 [Streptomyces lavendulae subsp. lavendulae]|uniref:Uncharacterized protein n=1 Tax=Streptomyces lavendulae subsp. lavendulae TaxID=58340 RepID=A0A2K8PNK4_STRLA|nr:hypothetical protein SLAV_32775 [Streptomyces lavendulae subsp. lavendulae]QUQ58155.1 hypothetical protein SLLC_30945 [Streptomyces lavendulae subsp. lavendulae]